MSRSPFIAAALAFCVGAVGFAPTANATTVEKTTESQRIARAELIVRGEVLETWVEQSQAGAITTHYMVEPSTVLKGTAPDGPVHIAIAGGTLGAVRTLVLGAARYNVGEEVLLLLEYKEVFDHYVTVSMGQGKYTIRLDPTTRREVIQRVEIPHNVKYDHRFLPFPDEDKKVFADDFEERVLGIVSGRIPVEVPQ